MQLSNFGRQTSPNEKVALSLVNHFQFRIIDLINEQDTIIISQMRTGRLEPMGEIKTLNSQLSDIDLFSKLEVNFLEKFFRYNLSDYSDILLSMYEDVLDRKTASKGQRNLASSLFISSHSFSVEEFQNRVDKFYKMRSNSIMEGELPYAFKLKYCSLNPAPNLIKAKQLILVDVKIKAEVQKIQELPDKIIASLKHLRNPKKGKLSTLEKTLSSYKQEYFTIFIAYFGDTNFNLFQKDKYQVENIKLFGRYFKVRIFVFFVSKQALIETFRTLNKINSLQYINDLVIQFYELKRQKQRRKRQRENQQDRNLSDKHYKEIFLSMVGICGLVAFGFAVKKIFS